MQNYGNDNQLNYQGGYPQNGQQQYSQPPPNYGPGPGPGPKFGGDGAADGKQTFEQTFKLEKPKYNDLWAGILVRSLPTTFPIDRNANVRNALHSSSQPSSVSSLSPASQYQVTPPTKATTAAVSTAMRKTLP